MEEASKVFVCVRCRVWYQEPIRRCPECSSELVVCFRKSGRFHFYEQDPRRKPKPCPKCSKNMTAERFFPKCDTAVPYPMELRQCEDCGYSEREELHWDNDNADYVAIHERT